MEVAVPVHVLLPAIESAVRIAEGKCALVVAEESFLVTPCGEGHYVQRLEAAQGKSRGAIQVPPDVLKSVGRFLMPFDGEVRVCLRGEELFVERDSCPRASFTVTAGIESTCGVLAADLTGGDVLATAPGGPLQALLVQAVPAPTFPTATSENAPPTSSASMALRPGAIEVSGGNEGLACWGVVAAACERDSLSCVLPTGLVRRAVGVQDIWNGRVRLRLGNMVSMGNQDSFVQWQPMAPPLPSKSLSTVWEEKASCCAWVDVGLLASRVPPNASPAARLRFEWNCGPPSLSVECHEEPQLGANPHQVQPRALSDFVQHGTTPICRGPGTACVSAAALGSAAEMLRERVCQLKIAEAHIVLGSLCGFVAIPTTPALSSHGEQGAT